MNAVFPTPSAGFDHPIEILDGCHERIRRQCVTIERIAAHLRAHGADADAVEAAGAVIRYFETAGAAHHRDEEDDLFPAMHRFAPSAELPAIDALIARLKADHEKLDALWSDMRARLQAVQGGDATRLDTPSATGFHAAYEQHIVLEESEVLPVARRILGPGVIEAIGTRMARRRGVTPPGS